MPNQLPDLRGESYHERQTLVSHFLHDPGGGAVSTLPGSSLKTQSFRLPTGFV